MAKGKLNWFQRLLTREIVGKVTKRDEAYKGIASEPVTLYTIMQEDRRYDCALIGHQSSPAIGDRVEVYTERGGELAKKEERYKKENSDGTMKIGITTRVWEPIKKYKILEDKLKE